MELLQRVQVVSESSFEKSGVLRDDRDALSQSVESDLRDVHSVNEDLSFHGLDQSKQRQTDCALACSCSSHDSHLLSRFDGETESLQHHFGVVPVPEPIIFVLDRRMSGPARVGWVSLRHVLRRLLDQITVVGEAFKRD